MTVKNLLSAGACLASVPTEGRWVVLNFWSPGYYEQSRIDGKIRRVFRATNTFAAAAAYIKELGEGTSTAGFKEAAHPGHVSLQTPMSYLSVGTRTGIGEMSLMQDYPINFSLKFEHDCFGFKRLPEQRIDLHSLDLDEINATISEFKQSKRIYNLLGNRFGFSDGESCATSCYVALLAGGLESLLRADHAMLGRNAILTPSSLCGYVTTASRNEIAYDSHIKALSKTFHASEQITLNTIEARIMDMSPSHEETTLSHEDSGPSTPKP